MPHFQTLADTPITRFFREFERHSDLGDVSSLVPLFAETFVVAGPQGAQCIRASDFALALPKRIELFDRLGCRSTSLVSLDEQQLDPKFTLTRTRWRMTFLQNGEEKEVLAESTFIVDTGADEFKIVFYLAHLDHVAMLKKHGILA